MGSHIFVILGRTKILASRGPEMYHNVKCSTFSLTNV